MVIKLTEGDLAKIASNALKLLFEKTAYHGGATDFDKFDLSYVNTGEGAQAYGFGVYVTESKRIGKHYTKAIYWSSLKKKFGELAANFDNILKSENLERYSKLNPWWVVYGFFKRRRSEQEAKAKIERSIDLLKRGSSYIDGASADSWNVDEYISKLENTINSFLEQIMHGFGNNFSLQQDTGDNMENLRNGNASIENIVSNSKKLADLFLNEYEKVLSLINSGAVKPEKVMVGKVRFGKYLYTVAIPDDNGHNYINWTSKVGRYAKIFNRSDNNEFLGMLQKTRPGTMVGNFIHMVEKRIGPSETSDVFAKLGFKGNRSPIGYLSGSTGKSGYNYIVYNDNNVKIIKKEILYKV